MRQSPDMTYSGKKQSRAINALTLLIIMTDNDVSLLLVVRNT